MQQSCSTNFLNFIEGTLPLCIHVCIDEWGNQCTLQFSLYRSINIYETYNGIVTLLDLVQLIEWETHYLKSKCIRCTCVLVKTQHDNYVKW